MLPFVVVFAAVMCGGGGGVPPPVLSYHGLMVLDFRSDGSVARRGFNATVAFISHTGVWATLTQNNPPLPRPDGRVQLFVAVSLVSMEANSLDIEHFVQQTLVFDTNKES